LIVSTLSQLCQRNVPVFYRGNQRAVVAGGKILHDPRDSIAQRREAQQRGEESAHVAARHLFLPARILHGQQRPITLEATFIHAVPAHLVDKRCAPAEIERFSGFGRHQSVKNEAIHAKVVDLERAQRQLSAVRNAIQEHPAAAICV